MADPAEKPKDKPQEKGIPEIKNALNELKNSINNQNERKKAENKLIEAYSNALNSDGGNKGKLSKDKAEALGKIINQKDIAILIDAFVKEEKMQEALHQLSLEVNPSAPAEKPKNPAEKIFDKVSTKVNEFMGNKDNEMVQKLDSLGISAIKIISGILALLSSMLSKYEFTRELATNLRYLQIRKDVENDPDKTTEEKEKILKKLDDPKTKERFKKAYKEWALRGEAQALYEQPGLEVALEEEKKEVTAEKKPDDKKPDAKTEGGV